MMIPKNIVRTICDNIIPTFTQRPLEIDMLEILEEKRGEETGSEELKGKCLNYRHQFSDPCCGKTDVAG